MLKYILIFIIYLFSSNLVGQQIIHTETWESGRIKSLSYHKMVDRGMGIELFKKVKYEGGRKVSEENYKDGKKEGLYSSWYKSGGKKKEGKYKNNEEVGDWTEWSSDGKKKREWKYNNDGIPLSDVEYHENGNKFMEVIWKDGEFMGRIYYKKDGSVY